MPSETTTTGLREMFRELTGLEARCFQIEVAHRLLAGENLVLVSPTGSGKSWAALLAFIYAKRNGLPFADRLIYAFPLRTLTTALYQQYKKYLERVDLRATLQMGGMDRGEGDPFFDKGDVIFTTIDQLLSSYIGVPVSLPRRLANMPAGALVGSCVVFDEFHLLESDKALATTLDLAYQLKPYAQMLLMSATFSGDGIEEIRRRAHAGKREVSPEELDHHDRGETQRKFVCSGREPDAEVVLDAHREKSIVVCNTVDRATNLYRDLVSLAEERSVEDQILLLHARFLTKDRKAKEKKILDLFGEESKERAILVATQIVEVGLDISSDVLHTELAPASAIFQRAGRCARFGGEGTVYVHELPKKASGERKTEPYAKETQASLVDSTGDELAARSGSVFGFEEEREVLDAVHAEADLRNLKSVAPRVRRREVAQAIREGSGDYIRQLVREVDAVNLIIHPNPKKLRMELPLPSISVSRSVVRTEFRRQAWAGRVLMPSSDEDPGESENYVPRTVWKTVEKVENLSQTFYLCLPPELAAYDPDEGLVLGKAGDYIFEQSVEGVVYEPYSYRKETWWDHIQRVMEQYEKQKCKHRVGAARLARVLGANEEAVERMGLLAAALHDLGKLARRWQDKVWLWQQSVKPDEPRDCFLGHSDFNGADSKQRKREKEAKYRKPPHAVESYYAGLRLLHQGLADQPDDLRESIVMALGSAIAHHHSAFASNLGEFDLQAEHEAEVRKVLERFGIEGELRDRPSITGRRRFAQDWIINPRDEDHEKVFPLYRYVVRRLRLADQKSNDW